MRLILLAALAPILYGATWKHVETVTSPVCGGRTFILDIPRDWDSGGEFSRLRIESPGQPEFVLTSKDGWSKHDADSLRLPPKVKSRFKNLLSSSYLYCIAVPAKTPRTLLFVIGQPYDDGPQSLDVIALEQSRPPRAILHENNLRLEDLRDLNSDGFPEVIGRKAYVEQWGGHYETYAPYFVYVLTGNADPRKTYSEPLSRTYNLKNYYGWTDPKSAQDYTVDLRPRAGGRPKVVKRPREDQ